MPVKETTAKKKPRRTSKKKKTETEVPEDDELKGDLLYEVHVKVWENAVSDVEFTPHEQIPTGATLHRLGVDLRRGYFEFRRHYEGK